MTVNCHVRESSYSKGIGQYIYIYNFLLRSIQEQTSEVNEFDGGRKKINYCLWSRTTTSVPAPANTILTCEQFVNSLKQIQIVN